MRITFWSSAYTTLNYFISLRLCSEAFLNGEETFLKLYFPNNLPYFLSKRDQLQLFLNFCICQTNMWVDFIIWDPKCKPITESNKESWPLNNRGLNCLGPLICRFFFQYTIVLHHPRLVESFPGCRSKDTEEWQMLIRQARTLAAVLSAGQNISSNKIQRNYQGLKIIALMCRLWAIRYKKTKNSTAISEELGTKGGYWEQKQ